MIRAQMTLMVLLASSRAPAAPGDVASFSKISDTEDGFTGQLDDYESFAVSLAQLEDIDGHRARP